MRIILPGSKPVRSLAASILMLALAGCAGHAPLDRNLPPAPARLTQAPLVPHLDSACFFPWFQVAGCKGKDERAMLRLTVSDDLEVRSRLTAVPGWYDGIRKSYGGH